MDDDRPTSARPPTAGEPAERGSLTEDLRAIEAALRGEASWPSLPDQLARAPHWLEDVAFTDEPRDADAVLQRAMRDARLHEVPGLAPLVARRAATVLGWGIGAWDQAESRLVSALEASHWTGDAASTASVAIQLAWLRGASGDLEGQVAAAREVAAAERVAGSRSRSRRAAATAAWAAAWLGRADEAEVLLAGPPPGERAGGALPEAVLALSNALAGSPADAEAALDRIGAADTNRSPAVLEAQVVTATVAGRPGSLTETAARGTRPLGPADPRRAIVLALCAVAAVECDDGPRARRLLDDVGGERLCAPAARCESWARLAVRWREEGPRAIVAEAIELTEGSSAPGTALDAVSAVWVSDAAREAEDGDAAGHISRLLGSRARRAGDRLSRHAAVIASANALLTTGEGGGDPEPPSRAAEALDALGAAGLAAAARAAAGRLAAASGDRHRAIALLTRAATDLQRLGARRQVTGALADLAGLGQDGRRAAAALGGAVLTGRELEIARLAAGGLTAQAIADRLVISRRTVETHLAHTYAKLGVRGRRELELRAEELGLR